MFFEVGPADLSGMGPTQLSFVEIKAWAELRDMPISPWEADMIRSLSRAYCSAIAERRKSD